MIDDEISLSLPAVPAFARLARLAVAGLAIRVGFTYDEVEDLRIAVGEACSILIWSGDDAGTLTFVFQLQADGMRIDVTAQRGGAPPAVDEAARPVDDLSGLILEAVVDHHEVGPGGVHLYKRRSDAGP